MRTKPVFFVLAGALCVAACDKSEVASAPPQPAPTEVEAPPTEAGLPDRDPALAWRLVEQDGALLLDVRSQEEFDGGHVEGATLIPHDQLADRMQEVVDATGGDKTKAVVVYCRSGKRAGLAKRQLQQAGFTQVTNLGGLTDWPNACDEDPAQCAAE